MISTSKAPIETDVSCVTEEAPNLTHKYRIPLDEKYGIVTQEYWETDRGHTMHSLSHRWIDRAIGKRSGLARDTETAYLRLPDGKILAATTAYYEGVAPQFLVGDLPEGVKVTETEDVQMTLAVVWIGFPDHKE